MRICSVTGSRPALSQEYQSTGFAQQERGKTGKIIAAFVTPNDGGAVDGRTFRASDAFTLRLQRLRQVALYRPRCVSNELPRWFRNRVSYPGRGLNGGPMAGEAAPMLAAATTLSRSGLRQTSPTGVQLRIWR